MFALEILWGLLVVKSTDGGQGRIALTIKDRHGTMRRVPMSISLLEEDIRMEATALQAGVKIPVLAEWRGSREKPQSEASMPEMPMWLKRSQMQGLSPHALERYLDSGWPISSIARDRNLEVGDIEQCLARWFHEA